MVHRFAVYLENNIKDYIYNVDIEYNRHLKEQKTDFLNNNRRVDLIVHQRGNDQNNYIYIEFKKRNDSDSDINKLKEFSVKYKYKNLYFITFNERKIYKLIDNELKEV